MKNTKSVILSIVIVFSVLLVSGASLFFAGGHIIQKLKNEENENTINITDVPIDNDYNNYVSCGSLAMVDETLYYNYIKDSGNYGLAKITSKTSKIISWNGKQPEDAEVLTEPILKSNNKIYRYNSTKNVIEVLNAANDVFEPTGVEIHKYIYSEFAVANDTIYYIQGYGSGDDIQRKVVCKRPNEREKVLIEKEVNNFYLDGDFIYYVMIYEKDSVSISEFYKYNIKTDEDVFIYKKEHISPDYFFVTNNKLIFASYNDVGTEYSVFKVDMDTEPKHLEVLYKGYLLQDQEYFDLNNINVCNNMVYIATSSGLSKIDLTSGIEYYIIENKNIYESYVIDDKWVYFVDETGGLKRISNDDKRIEKIYK